MLIEEFLMDTPRVATVVAALVFGLAAPIATAQNGPVEARNPTALTLGRVRALVVAPHPDDATMGAGGLIQRIIKTGGSVRVVQITGGDALPKGVVTINHLTTPPTTGAYRTYGSVREQEAVHAMHRLGVHRNQVSLLGFPDEGLCELASTHRAGQPFESPYTKRDAPPDPQQILPGTMYRGEDMVRELSHLLVEIRPTLVVMPSSGDLHPDHCAAHLMVHDALDDAIRNGLRPPRVLHYLVHYPKWPTANTVEHIDPPGDNLSHDWSWKTLELTPAERAAKHRALAAFESQMLVMADFLKSFERSNELFIEGEPALPIPCWCSGQNIVPGKRTVH
ncbi:MAG TPA: PIG-L family deacetylase [Vicinamibacterales bacterium]|jgi:LmbE family N-acetylglucosaminyl deacetylase